MSTGPGDKPTRQVILEAAIRHTVGERDLEYGPPSINLACAGELKAVFDKYNVGRGGAAFIEAMHMVLTKVGRVATSPGTPKADTFEDGAAYFAIAGEVHLLPQPWADAAKQEWSAIGKEYLKEEAVPRTAEWKAPFAVPVCDCGADKAKGWLHRTGCPANPMFEISTNGN